MPATPSTSPEASPARFNVLGVGVNALSLEIARDRVITAARNGQRGYVCFCDVNSVSCARRDPAHRAILNHSLLTTPDGMPLVWLGKRSGHPDIGRVYGPDLLEAVCAATADTELSHFFYGAGPGTAELLAHTLKTRFPGLRVAGTYTPPFRNLTEDEITALTTRVHGLQPHFFWVGLSTPKQEKFMAEFLPRLDTRIMLGVGAAFDFVSGRIRQAPRPVQRSGLEWLWRLCHEPRRLAPRYFKNNPLFVLRVLAQLSGLKKYPVA
jgi:N-acetylglucosaminyldiphosphoundecaprenol N-acetyl-beta-D-mannosaminyltransferase